MATTEKKDAYVGFNVTEARHEEIRQRARRDGRPMAGWMRDRLSRLFEIDDELADRQRTPSQSLSK